MQSVRLVAIIAALVACNGKLETNADASASDAGDEDEPWTCGQPDAAPKVVKCDEPTKVACQAWAQSLIRNGTALSTCVDDDAAAFPPVGCVAASGCDMIAQDVYSCRCGNTGGVCLMGGNSDTPMQVCVSDSTAPGGHCVTACGE